MKRLSVSFAGVAAGLAIVLVAIIWGSQKASFDRSEAIGWEQHTHEVLLATQKTLSSLQDAESSVRGYIISRQPDYLEPYVSSRHDLELSLDGLARMTRDNQLQQTRISDLRTVISGMLGRFADAVEFVRGNGGLGPQYVGSGRGKALMDKAHLILAAIAGEEERLLSVRRDAAQEAARRDQIFTSLLGGFGLAAVLGMFAAMNVAFRSAARVQLIAERAASDERLRMFLDRAPVPIAMFDTNMFYLGANRRYLLDYDLIEGGGPETLIGRSYYEVFPDIPESWRAVHRRVMAGEPTKAEEGAFPRAEGITDWVRWEMVPWYQTDTTVGGAILFSEIVTVRKQAERRQALLLELANRPWAAPGDMMADAAMLLARHFGASCAGFGALDAAGSLTELMGEYAGGASTLAVSPSGFAAFIRSVSTDLPAGRPVVVTDTACDPRTQRAGRGVPKGYRGIGVGSLVVAPLMADGWVQAVLYVGHASSRAWTTDEVLLVEEVAARTWLVVQQARAKDAMERSVEAFGTLANGIPTLCWMAQPDGHIYWYNQRWYDYTGTSPDEMAGWGWQSVHDPAVLPEVLEHWRSALDTGESFEMTFPLRGADGLFRPFMTRVAPVRGADGTVRKWLGVNTDVTEQAEREAALEQAGAALQTSEARLQIIFDTVPVGIVIAEASGRIIAANRQADVIFGAPMVASSDPSQPREWVAFHRDGRRVAFDEYVMARVLGGEARPEIEVLYHRPDGTRRWLRLIGTPLMTADRITGALVVALDIDHETRGREALSHAHAELERRVTAEVQAREAAQARLAQAEKMSALGQLAGGIAHDFNNVMQAVMGATRLIVRHADDPARVKRLGTTVEDATRRGASVTRRLLAFARRDELRAEAVDIGVMLDGLHEVLTHTLGAAITVQVDVTSGLLPVLADPGQLEAALVNLATNARDAMPTGGTITLSADAESVSQPEHPAGLAPGGYVRIQVADTGIGMDKATLGHVMEPFFTTKSRGEGTGLGLPMARGFAEQSGGALAIASEPGVGTTVTFWLPVTSASVARQTGSDAMPGDAEHAASRILLVDDEAIIRDVLAEELAERGYEVVQASRGEKALALLAAGERVDLLISDLAMPGMDGVTFIREAQMQRPRLPAILLTGYVGDAATLAVGGAVSGSFSLLRKPVSAAQLGDRVATLLEAVAIG